MPEPPHRTDRLRAIPLFAGLPEEALARIAASGTESEAPQGRVLIQQGRAGSGLFVLEEGTVVVERPGLDPIELGPGEFLGDLALLSPEGTHRARVRARTPVRFLAISRKDFARILDEEPRIAVAMLPILAGRLARLLERPPSR
jgi:CRP-like cAMP-binding protein